MYETFFGMEHTPFVRDIPADKLYESNSFRETLAVLLMWQTVRSLLWSQQIPDVASLH